MGNIHTSGPNEALIISGGCCGGENAKRTVVGGWGWAWWCVSGKFDLILSTWKNVNMNIDQIARFYIRCGRIVRDFERETKTRCNFYFR